jgi:(4S)-4-hydroxy-5-phosphonooxypentane-2,3-dione isomerase
MYVILGTIKVKPEHLDEFIEHVRTHAAASAREPGCVRYEVLQDIDDPTTICLYEVFRSETDLDDHHDQPHYREWMDRSRGWRNHAEYRRRVLRPVHPDDNAWEIRS